ncbi:histidine kinase [Beutenbergia cavernae DSM 12333]|uniref:Oxygen sensor histidine kinase NreB n=1 Tax=Beutenbergia cavernae (strain ATCC BAA-8 / DSM 12333 / CCUG 43141 / JCM 11478 / NBRC 16432 / NCIMB 13614 / HKI 0122) TaxID=471853 RepID=C5BYM1_BEUC1|nr:sensor histidine kinase [Beutenbergia cavernae]ACQ78979.1 histidine kinase [Beutenbergia cavernae DSM 12333]
MVEADVAHQPGEEPQRREWSSLVWLYVPLLALAPCLAVALVLGVATPMVLAVSAAVVVWHVGWVVLHPAWPESRFLPMAVYLVGLLAGAWWLKTEDFVFFPVLLSCFAMCFVVLPGGWAYAATAVTGVLTVTDRDGLDLSGPFLAILLGSVGLSSVIGWTIRSSERQERRERELRVELELAHEANLALQADLVREAHDAGVAAERARLAGEIHDTLAQGLAGVTAQLEAAEAELGDAHPSVRRVRLARDLARESLREARRSVAALRPGPLAEGRFLEAVRGAVAAWQERSTATADVRLAEPPDRLGADVEHALLRALTECLANVARHARAGTASVSLTYPPGVVVLRVRDDGVGFAPGARGSSDGGYGLTALAARATALGGTVDVVSAPGAGTTVTVRLPRQAAGIGGGSGSPRAEGAPADDGAPAGLSGAQG